MNNMIKKNWDAVGVFFLMSFIFGVIMFYVKWATDLPAHALAASDMLKEGRLFANNFLMYFCANLLSFFTGKKYVVRAGLTFLIVCAEVAKYVLVREMGREFLSERWARVFSLTLLFIGILPFPYLLHTPMFGLPADEMYYGYLVPNVWHNSTIICSMPFAIGMYWLSVKNFETFDERRNMYISVLTALCVLTKPSFFFIFAIAYPLILVYTYGMSKVFWRGMIPVAIGLLCVGYEFISIYGNPSDGSFVYIDIQSIFHFDFWKKQLPYLFFSLLFPLLYAIMSVRHIYKDKEFWFNVLMFVAAVGVFYICKEGGPRATHGNFYWQIVPAMWLLYYYTIKQIILMISYKRFNINKISRMGGGIWIVLISMHFLSGVWFVIRLMVLKTYA